MKKILVKAWDIIGTPSNNNSQVALAIAVIVASSAAGLICAILFGISSRSHGFGYRIAGGLVAVLSCIGAFAAGGMLGLLFGSPSWGSAGQATAGRATTDEASHRDSSAQKTGIRPNTSLERIADWLTTMIVGLTLVHLPEIEARGTKMAVWLTGAITGEANTVNGTAGIVIVISYSFAGFLLVYLWAMRFLPSELRGLYEDLSDRIGSIETTNAALLKVFRTGPNFVVPEHALSTLEKKLATDAVDQATIKDILTRYRSAKTTEDEPMMNFGKATESGYQLAAEVKEIGPGQFSVKAVLTIPSSSQATKVYWLLHNSFSPTVGCDCDITSAGASYETTVSEAFWLGAVVPVAGADSIRLGLWLGHAGGATPAFRPK